MVIYFSGTGNSKYIARILAQQLDDTLCDAAKHIKKEEHPCFDAQKPYVFVSPVYAWRLPRVFEKWIEKCRFDANAKAYFVLTCGDDIGAAGNYIQKFAAKKQLCYMGTAQVIMPENYIVMFSAPQREEDAGIIGKAEQCAQGLGAKILAEKSFKKRKTPLSGICAAIL